MAKIFFVGDFQTSYSSELYILKSLRELGHEVKAFQEQQGVNGQRLAGTVIMGGYDFVLGSKFRIDNAKLFIAMLKENGVKTVSWLFDLYLDLPPEMGAVRSIKEAPFMCDYVFMSDGGHDEEFKDMNRFVLRQGIFQEEAKMLKPDYEIDVAFIGSRTYNKRIDLVNFLRKRYGSDFRHFGYNAPLVRGMDLNKLLSKVRVVVGDSVPSDNYWSNRVYEILGRGGFLLHPKVKGLEKEFEYFKHLVPFEHSNYEQLGEIIDHYISHDEEQEKIRRAGFKFCKSNYTYKIRSKQLVDIVCSKS